MTKQSVEKNSVVVSPLGTTGYPSKIPYRPCYLVEGADTKILVDATPSLISAANRFRVVNGRSVPLEKIDSVLLTHVHSDHSGGLVDLAIKRHYICGHQNGDLPALILPESLIEPCWDTALQGTLEKTLKSIDSCGHTFRTTSLEDFFNVSPLTSDSSNSVIYQKTIHASLGGAFAYVITLDGLKLGFSGDTAPSGDIGIKYKPDSVLEFLSDCDIIIYEAGGAPIAGHTPPEYLVEQAIRLGVREKILATHYGDDVLVNPRNPGTVAERLVPDPNFPNESVALAKPWCSYKVTSEGIEVLGTISADKEILNWLS